MRWAVRANASEWHAKNVLSNWSKPERLELGSDPKRHDFFFIVGF